ncbi:ESCRT-0 subunit protein hse1 [Coemansia aciculifera]|nr:ESCRT-0 subunit protein hse1 [Coemansia aciculifera]
MEETYTKLRAQRFAFPSPQKPEKIPKQSDIERQKEEDDLQLALAISLSSVNDQGPKPNYQSPAAIRNEITRKQTVAAAAGSSSSSAAGGVARRTTRASGVPPAAETSALVAKRKVQVKALFDFTATEQGELGFFKGDVIDVLDQKYRDWWKGELRGKSGIFPANFVQPLVDLRAELSKDIDAEVQVFSEAHNIEALLRMLGTVDPLKDNVSDNEDVKRLYASTLALRPRIIGLMEKYAKKKDEMVALDEQFRKSMDLYEELMQRGAVGGVAPVAYQQQPTYGGQVQPQIQAQPQGQQPQVQVQQPHIQQGQQPQIQQGQPQIQQGQQPAMHPYGPYATNMAYSQPTLQQPQQPQQYQQQPPLQQQQQQPQGVPPPPQHMYYQPQQQQPQFQQPQQQQPQFQQPQPQFQQQQPQQPQYQQQQQFHQG